MSGVFNNLCLLFSTKYIKKILALVWSFCGFVPVVLQGWGMFGLRTELQLFGTLTFSFFLPLSSQNSALPDARFHSTSVKLLTGSKFWVHGVHLAVAFFTPLFFISVHKFGAVISGRTEPLFLRIILCAWLKP